MDFFNGSNLHLIIAVVLSCINAVIMCFIGSKFLQVIQLSGYKINGFRAYLKESKGSYIGRLAVLSFLSIACMLVTNSLLDGYGEYYAYIDLLFYFYFCIVFIINVYRSPQKTPLKQTSRMTRLTGMVFLLMACATFSLIALFSIHFPEVKFGIVAVTPILVPIIVPLAHFICYPFEMLIRSAYVKKAKKKLSSMPDLIKIGITGSYGKTTTKHILNVMLSTKYKVCMSPHSFNTPMGLTKVVNNYLEQGDQVLITEMGARQVGDISYLCKLIQPKHAIITGIGNQHLSTFGTVENVYKAKKELVSAITDGFICYNANNAGSQKMYNECKKNCVLCGVNEQNTFANITNTQLGTKGSEFDLTIDNKTIHCSTKLLGEENLQDVALSAAMAYKLGVNLTQIQQAIASLKPVAHRLELIEENGLTIIDNSFNSSVESSTSSLKTLALFQGNKIVVTPGLVELGNKEYEENQKFGERISKVANKVIIVNKVNKQAITEGLLIGDFNQDDILFADTLSDAKKLIKDIVTGNDVVLFENDLPDNYI